MSFGPVPAGWKGTCKEGKDFKATSCNRKLIGAQFFSKGYEASMGPFDETKESRSPRDNDGHGTHTSTTAAGSAVTDASLLGFAAGTARGMATRARVAVYKVCWFGGCFSSDILAAMEKGVDIECRVLSVFIGGIMSDYKRDCNTIEVFNAMEQQPRSDRDQRREMMRSHSLPSSSFVFFSPSSHHYYNPCIMSKTC